MFLSAKCVPLCRNMLLKSLRQRYFLLRSCSRGRFCCCVVHQLEYLDLLLAALGLALTKAAKREPALAARLNGPTAEIRRSESVVKTSNPRGKFPLSLL